MKILVITSAPTFRKENNFSAYSPYVSEMEIWFKFADQAIIASPTKYPQKIFTKNFLPQNIKISSLPFMNFSTLGEIFSSLVFLPIICWRIVKIMPFVDHIHLRCPGNIGLIGCVLQIFFPKKKKTAKYAGNWDPKAKQPWSYNLQKWILSNTFLSRNIKVLVYGKWHNQTVNIQPFFTASFSEKDKAVIEKKFRLPYKFLFVGNLVTGKQPFIALQIVERLNELNIPAELHIYGEGELKDFIRDKAGNKSYIHFYGNQPLEILKEAYQDSHFLILTSRSEGWPKVVAEAMFFGCLPLATPISCVPWMLGAPLPKEGRGKSSILAKRGLLTPPFPTSEAKVEKWLEEIVKDLEELLKNPEKMRMMSIEAQEWSQQYTLERFEKEIKKLLFPRNTKA